VALRAPVDWEPLRVFAPDQAPEALQAVALLVDQLKVALPPLVSELGVAVKLTVGEGALTETVADCAADPPGPVQVSVYVEVSVRAPVDWVPFTALAPDQAPDAAQPVAFAEDQVSVALPPLATALGPTLRLTVGVGDLTETVVDWVALPPGPLHVSVYVVLASTAPVSSMPCVARLPDQPPEAVHAVELVDDHVRVVLPPLEIVLGFALI
jgi:hypothetical protein